MERHWVTWKRPRQGEPSRGHSASAIPSVPRRPEPCQGSGRNHPVKHAKARCNLATAGELREPHQSPRYTLRVLGLVGGAAVAGRAAAAAPRPLRPIPNSRHRGRRHWIVIDHGRSWSRDEFWAEQVALRRRRRLTTFLRGG